MDKYNKKLPKQDLRTCAKEISKTLTASDFKHKRVEDPTKITEDHEKKVQRRVRDFFDKAVAKRIAYDKKKAEKIAAEALTNGQTPITITSNGIDTPATADTVTPLEADAEDKANVSDVDMSDDELHGPSIPATPAGDSSGDDTLKRKRDDEIQHTPADVDDALAKRFKADGTVVDPAFDPPPPPPPPPADTQMLREDAAYQMEENEDPAAAEMRAAQEALERENEEAAREEEMQQAMAPSGRGTEYNMHSDSILASQDYLMENGTHANSGNDVSSVETPVVTNGNDDLGERNGGGEMEGLMQSDRKEVLSN
jgi:[histone H3]-lysine36 N-trimethyltransferase